MLFKYLHNLRQQQIGTIIGTIDPVYTQMVLSMTWYLVLVLTIVTANGTAADIKAVIYK